MEEPTMNEVYELLGRTYSNMVRASEQEDFWFKNYMELKKENEEMRKCLEETKAYLEKLKEGVQNGVPVQNDSEGV